MAVPVGDCRPDNRKRAFAARTGGNGEKPVFAARFRPVLGERGGDACARLRGLGAPAQGIGGAHAARVVLCNV